jgi:hypothetical protein
MKPSQKFMHLPLDLFRYEEKFFIVWRDGNVYYNELGTRVKLAKRRYKGKKRNKIKLVVKPRELQESEIQQMVIFHHIIVKLRVVIFRYGIDIKGHINLGSNFQ